VNERMVSAAVRNVPNDGLAGIELSGGGVTGLRGLVSLFHHRRI